MVWYVYIIWSPAGRTYVGKTNDVRRRLRQHNGEISGGARATSRGGPWTLAATISGFRDERTALRAEWRLKHPCGGSRKDARYRGGLEPRLRGLSHILTSSDRWTASCEDAFDAEGLCLCLHDCHRASPEALHRLTSDCLARGWSVARKIT